MEDMSTRIRKIIRNCEDFEDGEIRLARLNLSPEEHKKALRKLEKRSDHRKIPTPVVETKVELIPSVPSESVSRLTPPGSNRRGLWI